MASELHPAFDPELATLHTDAGSEPFWAAARDHRLVAPRCRRCGNFRLPPAAFCWSCRSQETEWVELPGTAEVYSYTIAAHPLLPAVAAATPYVIAVVQLDGAPGARLITNIVGCPGEEVTVGMRVEVVWDDVTAHATIPRFSPIRG